MSNKNRILMVCYFFPPIRASAIARTLGFVNNLPKNGYTPVVLTVKSSKDKWGVVANNENIPKSIEVTRTYEFNLHRPIELLDTLVNKLFQLFSLKIRKYYFRENICIPDTQIAWIPVAKGVKQARECQCIYVSCSPFSSALYACMIKKITKKPLIVDFRDAWTLNPHSLNHTYFHRVMIRLMEKWVINTCDALLLNTNGALELYQDGYPSYQDKFYCIPNGYGKLNCPETINNEGFKIIHVGSFYGDRKPDELLDAISELDFKNNIEFIQVGANFVGYEKYTDKVNMTLTGPVNNEEALKIMASASLLYLKQGRENKIVSSIAVAAKTYEYISTGIPILCDCPKGDNVEIVEKYAMNSFIANEGSKEELKRLIHQAYNEKMTLPELNKDFVTQYSRQALTTKLSDVIDKVTGKC